jgi:diphosphomevalonate decarboxylase
MRVKQDIVKEILKKKNCITKEQSVTFFAPVNIALIKYWGKKDQELYIPNNSSLSVSLKDLGTTTTIKAHNKDELIFNNNTLDTNSAIYRKLFQFIDLFPRKEKLQITTYNNIPTAAGLASSSSAFASVTKCLNKLFDWNLEEKYLSIIARLGSGSACRSFAKGFVLWNKGQNAFDSFAATYTTKATKILLNLQIIIVNISLSPKSVSSNEAMQNSVDFSPLYNFWPKIAEDHLQAILQAIDHNDFSKFGYIAELNASIMHATSMLSYKATNYLLPETIELMNFVQKIRNDAIQAYYTIDAGPNVKILCQKKDTSIICEKLKLYNNKYSIYVADINK